MSSEHIVKSFDDQLRRLENLIAEMGGLAEAQLSDAIDAMSKRDLDKAARVTAEDQRIDDLELLVDQEAIAMLALRQPMAKDLREIVGALRAASMLERIGDHATNIAEVVIFVVRGRTPGDQRPKDDVTSFTVLQA